ncbi:MAG: hypothetical protein M3Y31_02595 [Gemmatimonadota bacterium]|nr:hypothetical protein [Gemmatimonadota bacterium]
MAVHVFLNSFVVVLAIGLMASLGGGREHLAGRLVIAIAAVLLLGWLDTYATRHAQRDRPLLAPDPPSYRRFAVWSSLAWFAATALLLGVACHLP